MDRRTDFAALLALSGMSQGDAAAALGVKLQSVKDMAAGRKRCPHGVLAEMIAIVQAQEAAAQAWLQGAEAAPLPDGAEAAAHGRYLVNLGMQEGA